MRVLSCSLLGLLLSSSYSVTADVLYSVTDLGVLPGAYYSFGLGINNTAQVTGYSGGISSSAFLYSNGQLIDIAGVTSGRGINNAGQITGGVTGISGSRAVVYSNGQVTDLGTFGGSSSYGYAINDTGQVAGYSFTAAGAQRAFLYSRGAMTDLGILEGYSGSIGLGINNAGQVTGYVSSATSSNVFSYEAFLYGDQGMIPLGTLGGQSSQGLAINDTGQVTGYAQTGRGAAHAFLYSNGQMTDLGTLGNTSSFGLGINNAGQVVGYTTDQTGRESAFIYRDGQMYDLNGLIDPALHLRLWEATAINDRGQIVANFGNGHGEAGDINSHAYLLTPIESVPEPGTLVLFGLVVLGAPELISRYCKGTSKMQTRRWKRHKL
ncbi:MAG TPA: DUF3466 family protein [Bryobacteraceae bacterium]|jgi:probable HAF family extracellular repeat protein|nr:DUF3466 family protein [Bryobacteraceae bacterium]